LPFATHEIEQYNSDYDIKDNASIKESQKSQTATTKQDHNSTTTTKVKERDKKNHTRKINGWTNKRTPAYLCHASSRGKSGSQLNFDPSALTKGAVEQAGARLSWNESERSRTRNTTEITQSQGKSERGSRPSPRMKSSNTIAKKTHKSSKVKGSLNEVLSYAQASP
jgi:hypothetical protein